MSRLNKFFTSLGIAATLSSFVNECGPQIIEAGEAGIELAGEFRNRVFKPQSQTKVEQAENERVDLICREDIIRIGKNGRPEITQTICFTNEGQAKYREWANYDLNGKIIDRTRYSI